MEISDLDGGELNAPPGEENDIGKKEASDVRSLDSNSEPAKRLEADRTAEEEKTNVSLCLGVMETMESTRGKERRGSTGKSGKGWSGRITTLCSATRHINPDANRVQYTKATFKRLVQDFRQNWWTTSPWSKTSRVREEIASYYVMIKTKTGLESARNVRRR